MILTPDILNSLEAQFESVWIAKGGEEINVTCPYCEARMGSPDRSGHLGLNFSKDAAHCVRCDWGMRGMRKWLNKLGFAAHVPMSLVRSSVGSLRKQLVGTPVSYQLGRCILPRGTKRIGQTNFAYQDSFASSLVDKRVSCEEARHHTVCYCDEGRYDGYVIFPFIEDDSIVYWQARAAYPKLLENKKLKKRNPSDKEANMGKAHWWYGYEFAKRKGTACITEGTLDQITTQSWIENRGLDYDGWYALSAQGTAISAPDPQHHPFNSQLGKLFVLDPEEVLIILDAEAYNKAEALAEQLYDYGFKSRAIKLPTGDPNETSFEQLDLTLGATGLDQLRNRLINAYE